MPEYRRRRVEGGAYFFTVVLADRRSDLLVREVAALRASVARVRALYPFTIDAWVVLPDHLHAVWTLPEGDADFSTRWMLIKRGFSSRVGMGEHRSESRVAKRERGVWQRRFWERALRDETDFRRHVDYVHFNPVRHGVAGNAWEWPFSSFRWAVRRGDYPAGWGGHAAVEGDYGERQGS
ncbi:REP-associated tyrosine transposase [Acidiphilium acidophilum]|uniref:REP-associated tyrosine transposase n=1 Tax=Acidiphilium acidophilum TaxID=76588 RepID=UPI003864CF90